MKKLAAKVHRLLAPRLVVLIGTTSPDGRKNIIPISNITSISTDPPMVIIAVYKPWITAQNLKTAEGFTISIPHQEQLDTVWKLGQKYSGYESGQDKIDEFRDQIDLGFSTYGPVLKDALGWIECRIVDRPKDAGANHYLVMGQYDSGMANPKYFTENGSPINNPKPFMQWESNTFSLASDTYKIDFYQETKLP